MGEINKTILLIYFALISFQQKSLVNSFNSEYFIDVKCPSAIPCDCLKTIHSEDEQTVINCSGRKLRSLPRFLTFRGHRFNMLFLNDTGINRLHNNALLGLEVDTVVLDDNPLSRGISDKAFDVSNGIIEISLKNCSLTTVPTVLKELTALRKIHLQHNMITTIPQRVFERLPNLEVLHLRHNKLRFLSSDNLFQNMNNLSVLDLSGNHLGTWPSTLLGDMPALHSLELAHNNLRSIPENGLKGMASLVRLNLRGNPIIIGEEEFPFDGLFDLEVLQLSHCTIANLNSRLVRDNANLKELALGFCSVQKNELHMLETLNHLSTLDMTGNSLMLLESISGDHSVISTLILDSMNLTTIPTNLLKRNPSLRRLSLEKNNISSIEENSFIGLKEPNIEINLNRNNISNISPDFIKKLNLPIKLNIANNSITDLKFINDRPCLFDRSEIDVSGNNIECSCEAKQVIQRKLTVLKGTCNIPKATNVIVVQGSEKNGYNVSQLDTTNKNKSHDLMELETTQMQGCRLSDRRKMKYSCCVDNWVPLDQPITCPVRSDAFEKRGSWVTALIILVLTAGLIA